MAVTATKERPILMNGDMVRAILSGVKTQTRRPIIPQPKSNRVAFGCVGGKGFGFIFGTLDFRKCPFGATGERLWVRETWQKIPDARPSGYFTNPSLIGKGYWYRATDSVPTWGGPWRPSIHMPRWACRLVLQITSVSVERVQDMQYDDFLSEGMDGEYKEEKIRDDCPVGCDGKHYGAGWHFRKTWDAIYAKDGLGWDVNPWVWNVGFRKLEST